MKRTKRTCLTRILVLVLVVAMLTPTTLAAGSGFGLSSWFQGIWDRFVGWFQPVEPEVPEEPEVPAAELTVVESPDTVDNGDALRASTYAVNNAAEIEAAGGRAVNDIRYFDVTMFDYDTDAINEAIQDLELSGGNQPGEWSGLYFNDGNPVPENIPGDRLDTSASTVRVYSSESATELEQYGNGLYYYDGKRISGLSYGRIQDGWFGYNGWTISYWNGDNSTTVRGNSITLDKSNEVAYADYNRWTGKLPGTNINDGAKGARIYSGLVNSVLNASGDIQFSDGVIDPGIFAPATTSVSGRAVYTNVGLPFQYDAASRSYLFDSDEFGAYGSADADNQFTGSVQSGANLYYDTDVQSVNADVAAGGAAWLPFNTGSYYNQTISAGNANYHFGLKAAIEFTMTDDGYLTNSDNEPITFEFSGDDDVWVFVDGILVLDIGGIHDRLGGKLDFAANTATVYREGTNGWGATTTYDINDARTNAEAVSSQLFNANGEQGLLNQTLASFAAQDSHTLTIFYLERGKGSSNCKIKFNLPVKDSVSVTKQVSELDDLDQPVSADTLASLRSGDYTFTLYKNGKALANTTYSLMDENGDYISTGTTRHNGTFTLRHGQTAKFVGEMADGDFYYVVESELNPLLTTPAFSQTVANAINDNSYTVTGGGENQSATVTMTETSGEAGEAISFVCVNTLKHVDMVTLAPVNETIVIDYGLPVLVDVLENDVVQHGTKALTGVQAGTTDQTAEAQSATGQYGTAKIVDGKIEYTLTEQLTGIEVFTYTVTATPDTPGEDAPVSTATLTIVPATVMYYEEDFGNLVTFSSAGEIGWTKVETSGLDEYQETGFVGDNTDSPYGSDVAYLDDQNDSNGTSWYVDTDKMTNAQKFSYTFTGTGTSIFARTTKNSGQMLIKVYAGETTEGEPLTTLYRDTRYIEEGNDGAVLYNIPVFTWDAVDEGRGYGTYTILVTLPRNTNPDNKVVGSEFWLDGIRVVNSMDPEGLYPESGEPSGDYAVAVDAYNRDGERNMNIATLRDKLINDYTVEGSEQIPVWDGEHFVLFTDSNGQILSADEYISNGPKEEVYLATEQSIKFSLENWDVNSSYRIWVGIKAPMGSGQVDIGGRPVSISNTTDCFYEITSYGTQDNEQKTITFTIENTGANVISLTNVKLSGDAKFTVITGEDIAEP